MTRLIALLALVGMVAFVGCGPENGKTDPPAPSSDPAETLMAEERSDALRRALESLTPTERRVVELAFLEGRTHPEVASVLGEPLGTIKSRIRRTLIKLHEQLSELEEADR